MPSELHGKYVAENCRNYNIIIAVARLVLLYLSYKSVIYNEF